MNYTTGPWEAYNSEKWHTIRAAIPGKPYSGNGRLVAYVTHWRDGQDWPNACLIASAPDMYEKLNEVREKLDNLSFNLADEESRECTADLRDEISRFMRKITNKEKPE